MAQVGEVQHYIERQHDTELDNWRRRSSAPRRARVARGAYHYGMRRERT